jgi:hypothetical protein
MQSSSKDAIEAVVKALELMMSGCESKELRAAARVIQKNLITHTNQKHY